MLDQIKPGYVLQFGTCPSSIISPSASKGANDNTRIDQFPIARSNLGMVTCISRVSGNLAEVCNKAATKLRGGSLAQKVRRDLSYSNLALKHYRPSFNTQEWQTPTDFVGYTDGRSLYTVSTGMVFSKDFSGCLMVVYTVGGQRRVAHVASSSTQSMDCKQAILTWLNNTANANLIGWFQPYVGARDVGTKIKAFNLFKSVLPSSINSLVTFGVINTANQGYTITAFKPKGITTSTWVVTDSRKLAMHTTYTYP